jgi:glycosyltransferase A (GT-A) superfamily protein (DUF2064 family)/8-oxo-dGTP pyrophosphatase MutT (NUDIX family)
VTVLVMAKAPVAGNVKTRLCPPLGLHLAARLAEAFLHDVLRSARSVDPEAGFLCPAADVDELARRFPGVPIAVQAGVGLASALDGAARTGAVVISGDAPGFPPDVIAAGRDSPADLTLAPSLDGGYCLLRMRRFEPAVFAGVDWSTPAVLDQTIAAARAAGVRVELLRPVADVDTADDLLHVDLDQAPATAAVLRDPDVLPFVPRGHPSPRRSRTLHRSPWRRLVVDDLPDGGDYAYLDTPAAVWVVPVSEEGDTMLVRQYRHPVRGHPLEAPAGSINPGEDPDRAARRELLEEVGGEPRALRRVGGFYSSSAHTSLRGLVYLATGVRFGAPTHAAKEGIDLVRLPFTRAVDLARSGELCEAQSALALILAWEAHVREADGRAHS